jgi:hypothetical protein
VRLVNRELAAVLALGAAAADAQSLNCRDGKEAPPRLYLVENLWGLQKYPSAAQEWPEDRRIQEIKAAGFDAFDVWVGGASEQDLARTDEGSVIGSRR